MITGRHTPGSASGTDAQADRLTRGCDAVKLSSTSLDAVTQLLAGDCGMGEQLLLIAPLRRNARIDLSDAEIKDLICEAIEEGWTAEDTLARLVALDDGSDGIRGADCCPR